MKPKHLLLLVVVSLSCKDIYEDFPVPTASSVAQFTYEITNAETRGVSFTNTSIVPESAGNTVFTWSFGDETTSGTFSPTHTFPNFGTYTVKLVLVAAASGEIKESVETITLLQPISIDFTLFYMDTDFLTIRGVGSTNVDITLPGFGNGLAIDNTGNKLYFVDDDNLQIKRCDLDGSNQEVLYEGLTGAESIALDIAGNRMFWTNRSDGTVHSGSMDGSTPAQTIINSLSLPEGIAYFNNRIYVSDVDEPPVGENIYVANANGSGLTPFVPGSWGYGLGIDAVNERLYFDDQGSYDDATDNKIRSVSLNDNTDIKVIATVEAIGANGSRAYGIAVRPNEGKVYWTDRGSRKIKRANLDGTSEETLLITEGTPKGLALEL